MKIRIRRPQREDEDLNCEVLLNSGGNVQLTMRRELDIREDWPDRECGIPAIERWSSEG